MMQWNDNFGKELEAKLATNLAKAAEYLTDKVKESLPAGDLHDSITSEVQDNKATVGSELPYALVVEYGSSKTPARPFLRGTLEKEKDAIVKIIAG